MEKFHLSTYAKVNKGQYGFLRPPGYQNPR